jgi:hypothetical protein
VNELQEQTEELKKDVNELQAKEQAASHVVVFRDKIYKLYRMHAYWYVYDYFSAPAVSPAITVNGNLDYLFTIDLSSKRVSTYESAYKGLSGKDFLDEMIAITDEEVPAKFLECILNIQRKKVAPEIPTKKILEHEAHHVAALQKELEAHISGLPARIYEELEESKTPLEKIGYRFVFYQSKIQNGLDILYEYPNADGKVRSSFGYYAAYLFEKLYPLHHTEFQEDYTVWIQMTVMEMLQKRYPYLTIEYVGHPEYIEVHLPHEKVLH